jgi:L-fuconolactonase
LISSCNWKNSVPAIQKTVKGLVRRDVLVGVGAASALAAFPHAPAFASEYVFPGAIDTHTHFYDPRREQGVPWPDKQSPLYRPVYPNDWLSVAKLHGVTQTVVVEASAWLEDNQWVLDLARDNPCIVGLVGRLSTQDKDFETQLKRFASSPLFRGIRLAGDLRELISKSEFLEGVKQLISRGLSLDINAKSPMHAAIEDLAHRFPDLTIVLNHVGSAGDANQLSPEWLKSMEKLGKRQNVVCKVSGLIEQSKLAVETWGQSPRDPAYYEPILEHCWNCYGEDRLIYGSNWPVCEKGGSYAQQFEVVHRFFGKKGEAASRKYFVQNPKRIYGIT